MISSSVRTEVLSVSEYSARLARAVRSVAGAIIEGEVQRPSRSASGVLWFSLTDGNATLSCKVFRTEASRLEHTPREGDLVRVAVERPDLWVASGKLDLIANQVRLTGDGELLRRREELIERLTGEGLCDPARRRPLPTFPRAVGVIAGEASQAMSDVIRALCDRWPAVHVITCPCTVQGKSAPNQLIDALARLQAHPLVEAIVIARGGGSVQDLACFDDERLCRALFACEKPVLCAIGHTDNNPVCNHVAWSAFTPSRSAELLVPSAAALRREIHSLGERLDRTPERLRLAAERVRSAAQRIDRTSILAVWQRVEQTGALIAERAKRRMTHTQKDTEHVLALIAARDFRRRGWLLASTGDGAPVRSAAALQSGQTIELRLHDGHAQALIDTVNHETQASMR